MLSDINQYICLSVIFINYNRGKIFFYNIISFVIIIYIPIACDPEKRGEEKKNFRRQKEKYGSLYG